MEACGLKKKDIVRRKERESSFYKDSARQWTGDLLPLDDRDSYWPC